MGARDPDHHNADAHADQRKESVMAISTAATGIDWQIEGEEIGSCNCDWGCPCQFNALPTHGNCEAVVAVQIDQGRHGAAGPDARREDESTW